MPAYHGAWSKAYLMPGLSLACPCKQLQRSFAPHDCGQRALWASFKSSSRQAISNLWQRTENNSSRAASQKEGYDSVEFSGSVQHAEFVLQASPWNIGREWTTISSLTYFEVSTWRNRYLNLGQVFHQASKFLHAQSNFEVLKSPRLRSRWARCTVVDLRIYRTGKRVR